MPPPPKSQASAPFSSRELNGDVLVEELSDLRLAQVQAKHLLDLANGVRDVVGAPVPEAALRLKAMAGQRFAGQPAVASLLVRWAMKLKSEQDLKILSAHLLRLAVTSALLPSLRRAAQRLPRAGR